MWRPAMFAAWVIQPMTTLIRKGRALVAASILTAVIMSFPAADAAGGLVLDRTDADRSAGSYPPR